MPFKSYVTLMATLTLFIATAALAANPHFIKKNLSAKGPDARGRLQVNFKIAGLGDNVTTTVTASANASAEFACRNRGGNFPSDPKKQQVTGPVVEKGNFTSGKNGQITGSLILNPPRPTLQCPSGQRAVILNVLYQNVKVSEPAAGAASIRGAFSRTFLTIN